METERIALSQRERDRLHVLHELRAFHGFSQHLAVLYTYSNHIYYNLSKWSGRKDLNLRPPGPEPGTKIT